MEPIFRLVFRMYSKDSNAARPLINYVHANSSHQANIYGLEMAEKVGYVFCYDETEQIEIKDIAV